MNATDKILQNLDARGIGYKTVEEPVKDAAGNIKMGADGTPMTKKTIVITNIPVLEANVNRFFSPTTPCWFEGCEELREEYNAALESVGAKGCTGCKKGAIMRKYEGRVREAIKLHEQRSTHTRTGTVSRSDGESPQGAVEKTSVLRRAADGLAQIFSHRAGKRKDRT